MFQFFRGLVGQSSLRMAVAGDGATLDVPDRPNVIYAHLGDAVGELIEVHISAVRPNVGDFFYVMPLHPQRTGGWRLVFWARDAEDASLDAPVLGSSLID